MKQCDKCKQVLDLSCFNKNRTKPDGLQASCRTCTRQKFKAYYNKNKSYHVSIVTRNNKLRVQKHRQKLDDIKSISGCVICGEKEACCLVFHHLDPDNKIDDVSRLTSEGLSWEAIDKEIKKCVILCENCHRKLHKGVITLPLSYNSIIPDS